jgi:selenocysteine lyase/cysteine desulfurase
VKLDLACASYELMQGLPCVLDYIGPDKAGTWETIAAHEERTQEILLRFLNGNERVTVYGEPSPSKELRTPVISFTVKGMKSQAVVEEVEKRSPFGIRHGHMYAPRLLTDVFGLEDVNDGVVRVSMVHYNTGK